MILVVVVVIDVVSVVSVVVVMLRHVAAGHMLNAVRVC